MGFLIRWITGHPLIMCIGFGVALMSMWWLKFQKKLRMKWYWAPILSVLYFVVSLALVRFWGLLEAGFDPTKAASMRVYGANFCLPWIAYLGAKLTKRNPALVVDIMSVCGMIGLFVVRLNCLIAGCCKGVLIFDHGSVRWPLVEIEMILCIILCFYYWQRVYKQKTKGLSYPITILIYSILRFILEWFREEYTDGIWIFHLAHIWALLGIVISALAIYLIKNSNRKNEKPHSKRKIDRKGVK